MRALRPFLACVAVVLSSFPAAAQYTSVAGDNIPVERVREQVRRADGVVETQEVVRPVARDDFGNARGNQNDLAIDGAFDGQTVAVLQLYTGEGFDFSLPEAALKEKGFSVSRWVNEPPSPEELNKALQKACQLWILSDSRRHLSDAHLKVIRKFFDAGHGIYLWGDNAPYYEDANAVGNALFGAYLSGNVHGDQTVGLQVEPDGPGLLRRHLLTTGLEFLYEGITISGLVAGRHLKPLLYGSAGILVAAFYDKRGKRALFDGGYTRLFVKWDTAGTARYVKNAAAWLANAERFGDAVVAQGARSGASQQPPSRPSPKP
ncbi:hypothetical protein KRR26_18370 [Corallococcus sp. M34]|uniref:hypothetical protein n=1 Tax=Citreicoccus inhibens TaxID=2849499 RepID=UPI0018F57C7C|nr:hypothetical protein [Citreicoccus inhibens]MBU8897585.1 hypothetical protein [Citreicoccus inhibens]